MMAPRLHPVRPRVLLAAGLPLAWDPLSAYLLRLRGIGEVEDHDDVADVAFGGRRNVRVAAIEIEPMHAAADRAPHRDQLGLRGIRHIVDIAAAAAVGA